MASSLPNNPSLDRLRRDARQLQRAARAGDADAAALVRRTHPHPEAALAGGFALHDAQLVTARRYGFSGWPALVHYLELASTLSVDPDQVDQTSLDPADRFCALATLTYTAEDAPPRWTEAAELLGAEPGLVDRHVWAAAAATDVSAVRRHLDRDPELVRRPGGPFGWVPLMYLAYARVPLGRTREETVAAATVLLDAGADPNAGYLWCGLATPFTVLTGVFGEGEAGPRRQPRHPHDLALARLLLERGAAAEDQQALYNRMFRPDDSHLELLFAYGLGSADGSDRGPWPARLGEALETPAQMWRRQLRWAADHGFADRLALLAAHGIDTSAVTLRTVTLPDDPNQIVDGATALHEAAGNGDLDRIRSLLAAGADPTILDRRFGSTPLGWAEHGYQTEAAELLRTVTPTDPAGSGTGVD